MTYDEVLATYGDPTQTDFETKNIVPFDLPYPLVYGSAIITRTRAHRLAVPHFIHALQEVKDSGLMEELTHYSGIFAIRSIRAHPGHPSAHSWGCAGDFNAETNQLGTLGHMDPRVVAIFKTNGFTWGGDFHARKDPMHFSLLGF
jgi:hypothetical protein